MEKERRSDFARSGGARPGPDALSKQCKKTSNAFLFRGRAQAPAQSKHEAYAHA